MNSTHLLSFLDPETLITAAGPWGLLVVCAIIFAETGLLVGFLLPGDTLLLISGLLTHTIDVFRMNIWLVSALIALAAFIGGEVGYFIGHKGGPKIFEKKETGLFSRHNVDRTNAFFERFGPATIILARFVPIVRTFAPVAAGIGHMPWKRYSLYNLIGAILWGFGLTMVGYVIAFIPPVAEFVTHYLDLVLLAAVAVTVLGIVIHFVIDRRRLAREHDASARAETSAETSSTS